MAQSSSAVVRYRTAGALDGRPGRALLCAVAAFGMIAATDLKAQTSGDFIDPLENLRQTLQPADPAQPDTPATPERAPLAGTVPAQPAPDLSQSPVPTRRGAEFADDPLFQAATQAREAMSGSAGQAEAAASTIWQRIRTASAGLSERIGMPVEWLLGGFGGTLALLSLFLGWRLFRIPTASVRGRTSDVYSRVGRSERRRVADRDEARPARGKAKTEADTDEAEEERLPLDGKRPLPLTEPDFAMNSDLADAPTITVPNRDPSTWKRPNLDRLRESIRSDWESAREEAEGGKPATAKTGAPEPAPVDEPANDAGDEALDALLKPEAPSHPADLPLREVASNWDDWDKSLDADGDVFGADQPAEPAEPAPARPSGDEALRRIRALREALKAS